MKPNEESFCFPRVTRLLSNQAVNGIQDSEIKSSIFSSEFIISVFSGTRSFLLLEAYSCVIKQFANWKPAWFPTMRLHTVLEKVKKKKKYNSASISDDIK